MDITRRTLLYAATASLLPRVQAISTSSSDERAALTAALHNTSASAVILHQQFGKILAQRGDVKRADTPGSILKPLILFGALQQKLVAPTTSVFCRRDLNIGNQSYPCT